MAHLQALTGLAVAACLATASFAVNGQAMGIAPKPSLTGWVPAVENLPGGGWRVIPNVHMRVRDQQVADAILKRIWSSEGGKFVAKEGIRIAGRAGELIVQSAKRLTPAQAAAVVARCFANPVCVAATAAAGISVALWLHYRIKPGADGSLEYDEGTGPTTMTAFEDLSGENLALTASDVAQLSYQKSRAGDPSQSYVGTVCQPPAQYGYVACTVTYKQRLGTPPNYTYENRTHGVTARPVQALMCQASIDFENPAYSRPAGPVMIDQKCPTARYTKITTDQAGEKYAAHPGPVNELLDALRGAVDYGDQEAPAAQDLTGPESQTGTPESSTTTGPEGTTTTTKTPVYNYTYAGDTITYQTTYRTETCTGANSCSTTTTTPPKPTEQDPEDPCTAAPDRAGCAKLGTPPNPEDLKKKDVPVSITPESGFGAGTGTCPGPIQLLNGATVDPFGLVCTYMSGIRFAIIGVAWLMAALIFLGRVD